LTASVCGSRRIRPGKLVEAGVPPQLRRQRLDLEGDRGCAGRQPELLPLGTVATEDGERFVVFDRTVFGGISPTAAEPGLDLTQLVLIGVVAFGLVTDYGVFLLSRICDLHRQGSSNRQAVHDGLAQTGRIITAAALLFCIAIGGLGFASMSMVREVGVGLALAVVIDATLVRAVLVPSLMALLGSWNWWKPGRLSPAQRPKAPVA